MTVLLSGTVLEVRPGAKVTRVMVAGTGRTNDLLMMPKGAKVAVGDVIERPVRPAIERNRENRVTGFITYWDADYEAERPAAAAATEAA